MGPFQSKQYKKKIKKEKIRNLWKRSWGDLFFFIFQKVNFNLSNSNFRKKLHKLHKLSDEYQQHLLSRLKHRHMLPLIPRLTHGSQAPVFLCPLYGQVFNLFLSETTKPFYSKLCLTKVIYG